MVLEEEYFIDCLSLPAFNGDWPCLVDRSAQTAAGFEASFPSRASSQAVSAPGVCSPVAPLSDDARRTAQFAVNATAREPDSRFSGYNLPQEKSCSRNCQTAMMHQQQPECEAFDKVSPLRTSEVLPWPWVQAASTEQNAQCAAPAIFGCTTSALLVTSLPEALQKRTTPLDAMLHQDQDVTDELFNTLVNAPWPDIATISAPIRAISEAAQRSAAGASASNVTSRRGRLSSSGPTTPGLSGNAYQPREPHHPACGSASLAVHPPLVHPLTYPPVLAHHQPPPTLQDLQPPQQQGQLPMFLDDSSPFTFLDHQPMPLLMDGPLPLPPPPPPPPPMPHPSLLSSRQPIAPVAPAGPAPPSAAAVAPAVAEEVLPLHTLPEGGSSVPVGCPWPAPAVMLPPLGPGLSSYQAASAALPAALNGISLTSGPRLAAAAPPPPPPASAPLTATSPLLAVPRAPSGHVSGASYSHFARSSDVPHAAADSAPAEGPHDLLDFAAEDEEDLMACVTAAQEIAAAGGGPAAAAAMAPPAPALAPAAAAAAAAADPDADTDVELAEAADGGEADVERRRGPGRRSGGATTTAGGGAGGAGAAGGRITMEALRSMFELPVQEVVRALGISATDLKRRCRALGIQRWPQRKLLSLRRLAEAVEGDAQLTDEERKAMLDRVARNRAEILADPDAQLEAGLKPLRQVHYKRSFMDRRGGQSGPFKG